MTQTLTGHTGIAKTIRERRTVRDFKTDDIPLEIIEELLNYAVWAPNHGHREPWRFVLFSGEGKKKFAEAVSAGSPPEHREKYGEMLYKYFMEVPVHLLVIMQEDPRQKQWEEDFGAVAALIQNFQLLAWEKQIGVVWKTNHYNWHPKFHELAGIAPGEKVIGTLHIGYINKIPKEKMRTNAADKLTVISG